MMEERGLHRYESRSPPSSPPDNSDEQGNKPLEVKHTADSADQLMDDEMVEHEKMLDEMVEKIVDNDRVSKTVRV